jgi:YVTN family beta-propeller protein
LLGRKTFLLSAILLASGCSRGSSGAPPAKGSGLPSSLLYVSDEAGGNVAVIDAAKAEVVATIPVGKRPRGLKLSPDGHLLYVALSGSPRAGPGVDESKLPPPDRSADGVGVVDLSTRKLVQTFPSGQDPESFDISPDGKTLYVSNEETAEMTVLELPSGKLLGKAQVGHEPEGVTVAPGGKFVFVTSEQDNEVTVVDAGTLVVAGHIPTGRRPRSIVFGKDGLTAYVTCELGGVVTVVDTAARRPLGDIKVTLNSPMPSPPRPMGAVLSPDGKSLYVTSGRGGSVAILDTATRSQVRSLDGVGDRPWGIAVSRDGAHLYTANGTSADVSIINLATGNVDKRAYPGGLPWGVVVAD